MKHFCLWTIIKNSNAISIKKTSKYLDYFKVQMIYKNTNDRWFASVGRRPFALRSVLTCAQKEKSLYGGSWFSTDKTWLYWGMVNSFQIFIVKVLADFRGQTGRVLVRLPTPSYPLHLELFLTTLVENWRISNHHILIWRRLCVK
jgi:hypothetical protein